MISVKRAKKIALIFVVFLLLSNSASAADEAVLRKVLESGLTFLVKETPPKDMVSITVTVKAGITSEEGYTASGISHLVEHMLFKGTKTRKVGDIEREIGSYGGSLTGEVSSDITTYQATVPSRYMTNTLAILKDMLLYATFDKTELEKEREVILKEINMNKDDPERQLILSLFHNAYLKHPYKYPAIGYERLLKSLTRDDLLKYYNRIYVPNRMVVSVAGDIDKEDAASKIETEFKSLRAPDYRPVNKEIEPAQIGAKCSEIESGVTLSYLAMAFHSTSILDKDLFSLDVLSMILGRGDNSRLNKKLVKETGAAYSVSASNYTPQDPGLFIITAILDRENIDPARKDILSEINMVKKGVIDDKELERARRMAVSDYILSHETAEGQARNLGESEILTGNYDFSSRYIDGVGKVTKYDVMRAASIYLGEDNLTEVRLVPGSKESSAIKIKKAPVVDKGIEKYELSNGLRVLARRDTKVPAVSVTIAFSGGLLVEDKNTSGISNFVSRMLLKGTKTRNEDQIKGAVENLGGDINSFSGFNSFGLTAMVLKDDLNFISELIKDILANSDFPQREMDIEKSLVEAAIKDEDDDIFQKGLLELRKNLFEGHPYSMRYAGEALSLDKFKRDDIVKFYQTYCVPNNTIISVSGDIEPSMVFKKIEELFKDEKRKEIPAISARPATIDRVRQASLDMDKEETLLIIGFKTIGINNPDRYALDVLESVLSGISGRLFNELRDRSALAYTLGCAQSLGLDAGYMVFYVATTKDKLSQARNALLGQLTNIKEKGACDDEMASAKKEIILNHQLVRQTNAYCSLQSAVDELYGLGADNMYQYENNIEKVTKSDVQKAAKKYLDLNRYAEVVINPS